MSNISARYILFRASNFFSTRKKDTKNTTIRRGRTVAPWLLSYPRVNDFLFQKNSKKKDHLQKPEYVTRGRSLIKTAAEERRVYRAQDYSGHVPRRWRWANFRPSGRANRKMSIGRVVRAHRVPSEFHYAHKPYGQFQATPLVHLKWQHERITDPSVTFEVTNRCVSERY